MNEHARTLLRLLIHFHHAAMLALVEDLHRELTFTTYGPEWPFSRS